MTSKAKRSGGGRMVVISGPSGSGKTTICRALAEDPRVRFSVSATTRPKRSNEVDGRDYFFLSEDEFERRVQRGEFLEQAHYNGHRYGTLRSAVDGEIAKGFVVILEIEVQGTRLLREQNVEATYVLIMPPSLEELERRLTARSTEDAETIRQRLVIARGEMDMAHLYDHVVINADLQTAIQEVRGVLGLLDDGAKG